MLLPGSVTVAPCTAVVYAMEMRTCFKARQLGDDIMIHSKATIVETSLQAEGFLDDPKNVCE